MAEAASVVQAPEIPDKLYFRIGEVASLVGVEAYVLRYWETEFSALTPKKSGTGHRLYRRKDVELLLRIKHLLYEKRFTIEGARQHLHDEAKTVSAQKKRAPRAEPQQQRSLFSEDPLPEIRKELNEILSLLQ
jgi:DNA-binding transcriptional MerR regulator